VVVMDLSIPEPEDGLRLIQAIAGAARIIVLSGGEVDPTLPVDEFLTKPCPSRTLLAAIEKWKSSVT
jgi:YesN/AraC family two-component response regulator